MNSNTAISLASAVVATAALFISIWNAWATRRHNRLSVRPHLALSKKTSPNAPQLTIDIKNNGLGPAIMTSIRVFVDDIDQSLTRAAQWQDIVAKLRYSSWCQACYYANSLIAPSRLAGIGGTTGRENTLRRVRERLNAQLQA
jgi:hypothetical protein